MFKLFKENCGDLKHHCVPQSFVRKHSSRSWYLPVRAGLKLRMLPRAGSRAPLPACRRARAVTARAGRRVKRTTGGQRLLLQGLISDSAELQRPTVSERAEGEEEMWVLRRKVADWTMKTEPCAKAGRPLSRR